MTEAQVVPFKGCPLEDDGSVDLALMATDHPQIKHFGKVVLEHIQATNKVLEECAPWCQVGPMPSGTLLVFFFDSWKKANLGVMHKEIEHLDSIDLNDLKPGWGDKATIRMSRKTLIGLAQQIMELLDDLQGRLAGPASREKQMRAESVTRTSEELSLQQKYRDKFKEATSGEQKDGSSTLPDSVKTNNAERHSNGDFELPRIKRRRANEPEPVSAKAVQDLLNRVLAKINQPLHKQSLHTCYRQLTNFAAIPDLAQNPTLCRSSIECALDAIGSTLDAHPECEDLCGKLFSALVTIESLADPTGLPEVLSDLANSIMVCQGLEGASG